MKYREKLYNFIEPEIGNNKYTDYYDIFMIIVILCSFIPLMFKEDTPLLRFIDIGATIIFIIDYILRWTTADFHLKKQSLGTFLRYPFTPMAIVDLLSILPVLAMINPSFRLFRFIRLFRAFRVLRVARLFRYSRNLQIIMNVFRKQKQAFLMVLLLTLGYVFVSAAVLFQIEPETFGNFFEAVYWAVVMLTTIGYGDVVAATTLGKLMTVISAIMGVAVIALPAGLITAGYITEVQNVEKETQNRIKKRKENNGDQESDQDN